MHRDASGEPLPPPTHTPEAIAADPAAYRAAGRRAIEDAAPIPWWGWALGAVGAALGIVRLLPGPGGALHAKFRRQNGRANLAHAWTSTIQPWKPSLMVFTVK